MSGQDNGNQGVSGDHDNGVNGVVEGSKSTSQLIQNFNSAVGSYRFLFLRLSQPVWVPDRLGFLG